MYALNALTGECVWRNETAEWIGSSPCYIESEDLVCVGMEYAGIVEQWGYSAFDVSTGELRWSTKSPKYTHGSPVYSEKHKSIFGGSNDGLFYRIDISTGEILWIFSAKAEIKSRPTLSEDETYVFFW
jgi:outer membrane protein assembly factor BamB